MEVSNWVKYWFGLGDSDDGSHLGPACEPSGGLGVRSEWKLDR